MPRDERTLGEALGELRASTVEHTRPAGCVLGVVPGADVSCALGWPRPRLRCESLTAIEYEDAETAGAARDERDLCELEPLTAAGVRHLLLSVIVNYPRRCI